MGFGEPGIAWSLRARSAVGDVRHTLPLYCVGRGRLYVLCSNRPLTPPDAVPNTPSTARDESIMSRDRLLQAHAMMFGISDKQVSDRVLSGSQPRARDSKAYHGRPYCSRANSRRTLLSLGVRISQVSIDEATQVLSSSSAAEDLGHPFVAAAARAAAGCAYSCGLLRMGAWRRSLVAR
jgi:hypothetical protein